jgi:hypothetical protein
MKDMMNGRVTRWNKAEVKVIQIGNLMRSIISASKAKAKKEKQNG